MQDSDISSLFKMFTHQAISAAYMVVYRRINCKEITKNSKDDILLVLATYLNNIFESTLMNKNVHNIYDQYIKATFDKLLPHHSIVCILHLTKNIGEALMDHTELLTFGDSSFLKEGETADDKIEKRRELVDDYLNKVHILFDKYRYSVLLKKLLAYPMIVKDLMFLN